LITPGNDQFKEVEIKFTVDEFSVEGDVEEVAVVGEFTSWKPKKMEPSS